MPQNMELIEASNLHNAVKFLKDLRVQIVEDLSHYGNYGLFFKNDEITTGLMNNQKEIKINLVDGNFHYYDTEFGITIDLTKQDSPQRIFELLEQKGLKIPNTELESVPLNQMHRYREFSIHANRCLELVRMKLEGQYTHVYLWGHNFDFDLVWFSGNGEEQIDIGVSPGDVGHPMPYLYITPRPFNEAISFSDLPIGIWHTDTWKGILVEWSDFTSILEEETSNIIFKLFNIAISNFS